MQPSGDLTQSAGTHSPASPVILVTGGDEGFALGMAVMLHSALTHLPQDQAVRIYLLDGGVHPAARMRIEAVIRRAVQPVELLWLTPDPASLDGVPVNTRHTISA